jgi:predicted lysophospholipase L1 biosynthesis ABC-type transport system permease subunit
MSFIGIRARADWRRHAWELVVLTLFVGLVGTVVLTTVAGARRTRSTVERMDRSTLAPDVFVMFAGDGTDAAHAVAQLPVVESADRFSPMSFFSEQGYLPVLASIDGRNGDTIARDRVIRGRRPRQTAPFEVALAEPLARRLRLDVGDRLPLTGISAAQSACVFGGDDRPSCAEFRQQFFSGDFTNFAGPRIAVRVVGITRGLQDVAARAEDFNAVYLTQALYERYREDVATQTGMAVRLKPGTTLEQFEAAAGKVVPRDSIVDFSSSAAVLDGLQSTVGVLANGLLVFALVAALAGFAAIIQILARRAAIGAPDRSVLRTLGASRRALIGDVVAPIAPVALVGGGLAVLGSWLASPLMPIGTARRVEPHTGFQFDVRALMIGGGLIVIGILASAAVAGWWVNRPAASASLRRHSSRTRWLGSVPAIVGRRLAFDRGGRVPLRSALAGVALGTAGVVAVGVFGAGLTRLGNQPARYGYGWDLTISGERASDPEAPEPSPPATSRYWDGPAARIAADPDVERVSHVWLGVPVQIGGGSVLAAAERGADEFAFVIVSGRRPTGPDEVALGAKTMRRADVDVGDRVRVGDRSLRVVGQAVFPVTEDGYPLADGALFSADGFAAAGLEQASGLGSSGFNTYAVELRSGSDRAAAMERLRALNRGEAPSSTRVPAEVDQLEQLDRLPTILALFLALVALLALGHTLVLTVRHRRSELAVVRTIGLTPGQTARTVGWQATTLGVVGALIGIPIGLVLGRIVWAAVARGYGLADDPAWPWLVVALAVPVVVVLANALAWWPGRRAAHLRPADILHAE